jgi:hypothetical protein
MEMGKRMLQMLELVLARQEEAAARQEKRNAEAKARHERFLAFVDGLTSYGKGTTTCQTETTSCPEEMKDAIIMEATLEATEAAVERQELLKEEINVDNIGSSVDRCEDRRLVSRRRRGAKKRPQDSVGSRQKSSAACKRVIRGAVPAVRKGHIRKSRGRDSVTRGASGRKTLQKRQRNCECKTGKWGRVLKKQLRLCTKWTSDRAIGKTTTIGDRKASMLVYD